MYQIKRTVEEIYEVLNLAAEGENEGSRYPGMSYEQGINAFWMWLIGDTDEEPFD